MYVGSQQGPFSQALASDVEDFRQNSGSVSKKEHSLIHHFLIPVVPSNDPVPQFLLINIHLQGEQQDRVYKT